MPNWCDNTLKIVGEEDDLKRFIKTCCSQKDQGIELDLEKLWKPPKNLSRGKNGLLQKYIKSDTLDEFSWKSENWGTDRINNSYTVVGEPETGTLIFEFLSAWEPPTGLIKRVVEKFKNLKFILTYEEAGLSIFGLLIGEKGKIKIAEGR